MEVTTPYVQRLWLSQLWNAKLFLYTSTHTFYGWTFEIIGQIAKQSFCKDIFYGASTTTLSKPALGFLDLLFSRLKTRMTFDQILQNSAYENFFPSSLALFDSEILAAAFNHIPLFFVPGKNFFHAQLNLEQLALLQRLYQYDFFLNFWCEFFYCGFEQKPPHR